MPNKKRMIKVFENGVEIYNGPDNRTYNKDYIKCALGLPITDWMKYVSAIGAVIVVIYNASTIFNKLNDGISRLDNGQNRITSKMDYFNEWTQNNDNFWGAYLGTRFKDGKPVNDRFIEWDKKHKGG